MVLLFRYHGVTVMVFQDNELMFEAESCIPV